MQRSTQLKIATIGLVVGSCLVLVASCFMAFFTWAEYFVPSHLGSVRGITEPFYVVVSIVIFEMSASVLGFLSASNIRSRGKLNVSILGATFLLIAGLLFFNDLLINALPHIESPSIMGLWSCLQTFFGIPVIVISSTSLVLLVLRRKEFTIKEINPLFTLKVVLILCSIISLCFAFFSIVPYFQAIRFNNELASSYPRYNIIVNSSIFVFASIALTLVIKKKYHFVTIALTAISLLLALTMPFIFNTIFPWIGSVVKGFVTESPVIILSITALAFAVFGQIEINKLTSKSLNTQVKVS